MNKQIKKLQLNKETIATLSNESMHHVIGGDGNDPEKITFLTTIIAVTVAYCTGGNSCDMPTIGHDDGSYCISKEANWCHGRD